MAESRDYTHPYTDSNIRCLKCISVVMEVFPKILQKIMDGSILSPTQLYNQIQRDPIFRKKLTQTDHQVILTLMSDGFTKLDITLIFKIITYFNVFIPPPTRGWSSYPAPTEITIGDEAQRLRLIRNKLIHKVIMELTDDKFEEFFTEVISICERVDGFLQSPEEESFKRKVETFKTRPLMGPEEVQRLYDEERPAEYFIAETGNNSFNVYKAKSLKCFIQQIKDSRGESQNTIPITLTFPEISRPEFEEIMNGLREEINQDLVHINVVRFREGSLLVDIMVPTAILLNDENLQEELTTFLRHLSTISVWEENLKTIDMVTMVMSECEVYHDEDQYENMCGDETMYSPGSLQIDLQVKRSVLQSEEMLQTQLETLFVTIVSKSNGNQIFPSDKPIISVVEPGIKGVSQIGFSDQDHMDQTESMQKIGEYALKMSTEDKMIYTQDAEGEIEDTEKIYTRVTKEEENYLRLVLLLTGISTRAVRVQFDKEFSPLCLDKSLQESKNRLEKLKNEGMISQEQWNLLFPRAGKKPESTNFDVTLMIKLLRHLTDITQPNNGWDKLPDVDDTSIGADLARIKYYRNKSSHLENAKIDSSQFDDIWNSVSGVIERLGGCQLVDEATGSKYKTLNSLETAYDLKGEIKKLQDPSQIREKAKATLAEWRKDDKEFVVTEVAQSILNDVKKNKCVTIIGNSGIGKTATIRHVSLLMADSGYDVFPFADPLILEMYKVFSVKMLFVVDDFCGCCSTNITELEDWKRVIEHSGEYLNDNIKLVVACRLQVFQDNLFKKFSFVKSCICNMSDDLRYSNNEFKSIAKRYLPHDSSTACVYQNVNDCFPLLCRLYKGNPTFETRDFFQKPFSVYEREMDIMFTNHRIKYCALALCVCFNNCIKEEWLTDDIDSEKSLIFQELYKACQLNKGTLRTEIRDELETLLNSFLKKRNGTYSTLHDKLFDFLSFHCSKNILTCLIRNANSSFIRERFMLVDGNHPDEFIIKIPNNREQHSMFLMRMIDDWRNGHVEDVFLNCNMQVPQFRNLFFELVNSFSESDQRALANTCDIGFGNNLLHCLTLYGDITCILWCLHHGVDVNKSGKIGATPLHRACLNGYSEIVKILIENQADINICTTDYGTSSLYIASEECYPEIVKMLLDNGADTGKCASGQSPLYIASQHGHKEIVKLLLAYGANIERGRTDIGASPLHVACEQGREDVVLILLEKKADIHGSFVCASPLFLASQEGHAEIVKILLDARADINRGRTDYEMSPLYIACLNGCIKIVEILLINKPEVNKCSKSGATPLYIACFKGYTEIVKRLLLHDADTLKCTEDTGESPLFVACQQGHEKIVELLLIGKADVNKCRNDSRSPLHEACLNGYTEIVKMLLKKGAKHNVFLPTFGRPIDIAVKKRHAEIVNILEELK